ncbi:MULTISPECIES: hypothetical protein [unclassified Arthrobacter]|uniref:hypothetical protein n=1 Tax=unclassified Arthrobacter TaxID=235627 RepID=UPI0009A68FAA|nr:MULTISPECIES: hypothetical protein [unclassified Arthrobacter]RDV12810.1 hypothetical protein DXK94_00880 [Arthrobacter sp. RT-1]SLJ97181.1 hypothetical protein SAMN06272721_102175 [Arthrobacter sp. P2b]
MSSVTPLEKAAQRSRHLLTLVTVALIGCLGGCEYEFNDASLPSASSPVTEARTVSPLPESRDTRTVPPLPESGDIDAGTYLVPVAGYKEPFEITVPDGWFTLDGQSLGKDDRDHPAEWAVYLTLSPADYVSMDACTWPGALADVGPSAEAFVKAMAAQSWTVSTPPVEVMVGDYSGVEFDHSVEGDVDFITCGARRLCIHSESNVTCSRWYLTQNEHETYRVVDLEGQRAVVSVGYIDELINPVLMREARAVFDSIAFRSYK